MAADVDHATLGCISGGAVWRSSSMSPRRSSTADSHPPEQPGRQSFSSPPQLLQSASPAFLRATPGYVAGTLWGLVAAAIGASQRDAATLSGVSAVAAAAVLVTAVLVDVEGPKRSC